MKSGLEVGKSYVKRFEIDKDRTIGFMGDELRVYASPSMARDMENTCREFLDQFLEENENSVGARIELDHMGPSLIGMQAEITVKITAVEGRKVSFTYEVFDAIEQVGQGRHIRFVVPLDRQRERLQAKAAKMKDGEKS